MDDRSSFYCVIGAGPVGLSVANALARAGIGYEQLEADADLGGNWRHGVYSSAHIISSRKTTEYADYPMPADYPDFPSAEQMRAYLADYADHFDLRRHIQFNTRVEFCRPLNDHRWEVELANGERRIYRGVLVCNGHHWDSRWPSYPGEFTGEYIHSKQYRNPDQLRDKRVLVIGGGNSACDVASEAARVGRSAAISIRHGYWFLPKTLLGKPLVEVVPWWTPVWAQRLLLRVMLRVIVGRYEAYGLPKPDHRIFEKHPTLNSELLHYIRHGRITPRPDIRRFDGRAVEFVDGSRQEFDMVVAATGFHVSFPFLPQRFGARAGWNRVSICRMCAAHGQKPLCDRYRSGAIRIWSATHTGSGAGGCNDSVAGKDGVADRAGDEGIRRAIAHDASGGSA
jgi:cation diffusion facilitator CzcD-associated flavoprotein CzcO